MQPGLLPLFPLNIVLFPGSPLPLHIFEDRYKEMFGEVLRDKTEFGVVLATEKGIANAGCTATVEHTIRQYPDGRMDLLTIGRRRFEINLLNEERPFLRGDVHFFDDEEDEEETTPQEMRETLVREIQSLGERADEMDTENPRLSFALAQKLPDLEARQLILSMRSEADRIQHLAQILPGVISRQKVIDHMRSVAPLNGHGHHLRKGDA